MANRKRPEDKKSKRGRKPIWTMEKIAEHGKSIVDWAYKTDTWRIKMYFIERRISLNSVDEWEACSPEFHEQITEARKILLEKFHVMIGFNMINNAYACRMLRIMDKEYNEACTRFAYEDKRAETKAQFEVEKESGNDNIMRIVFEDRPSDKNLSSEYIPIP